MQHKTDKRLSSKRPSKSSSASAPRHVTSMEVARLAGVHQSTVSRVLNNPDMVNDETRRKVKQAIVDLNYRPWSQARSLATQRHEMVGLITDLSEKMSSHHVALVEGVVESLTEAQYAFTMATVPRKVTPEQLMNLSIVRQHSCDGLIFNLESLGREFPDVSSRLGVPAIWVNPAFRGEFDCVVPDDQEIAETAVGYLISKGHRRIAYLNSPGKSHRSSIEQRQRGYEMAMLRAKLDPMPLFDRLIDNTCTDPALFEETVLGRIRERLMFWWNSSAPPTAIVTYHSSLAVAVGRIAYQENWRIPATFSLISCDDETSLEDWPIPITAVKTNRRLCGVQGVQMLFGKLRTGASIPTIQVKGELAERKSVQAV